MEVNAQSSAMETWQSEILAARDDFLKVAQLGGVVIRESDLQLEFLGAPHRPPSKIPAGTMAIYAFWGDGCWLKIGKVGPNSHARYSSQHYLTGSAPSTLAGSLAKCTRILDNPSFDRGNIGGWIKQHTCRVNLLLPKQYPRELLNLLEAFLHLRLRPRYEG